METDSVPWFREAVMKRLAVPFLLVLLAVAGSAPAVAQPGGQYTPQELERILAPVALYPDDLLTTVLMAATYPDDVAAAAEFVDENADLPDEMIARKAEDEDWDPSVKALVQFPDVLDMMDDDMAWTQELGEAFLNQPGDVMAGIERLRRQALQAGNPRSGGWRAAAVLTAIPPDRGML